MDLSFSLLPMPVADAAPPDDAAMLLAAIAAYRCASHGSDRHPFAPASGAFNGQVARLLTAWQS